MSIHVDHTTLASLGFPHQACARSNDAYGPIHHANARASQTVQRNPTRERRGVRVPRTPNDDARTFSQATRRVAVAPPLPTAGEGGETEGRVGEGELGWMAEIRSQNPTPPPADTACQASTKRNEPTKRNGTGLEKRAQRRETSPPRETAPD